MRFCPNCHKMSKDDDFCSHCGCAVYGDNEDRSADIDCSSFKGHEHEHDGGKNPKKGALFGCIIYIIIMTAAFWFIYNTYPLN